MNRAAMVLMLALTACGGGEPDRPPVNENTVDATDREATVPEAAPAEAAPVDARHDAVTDAGPDGDARADARDAAAEAEDGPTDAAPEAEAEAGPPPPAMCCSQGDDASEHVALCSTDGGDPDCRPSFCTFQGVRGMLAACPVCAGTTTAPSCPSPSPSDAGDGGDAGDAGVVTLSCQLGAPQTITLGSDLLCVCSPGKTCVYDDTTHCTAECL